MALRRSPGAVAPKLLAFVGAMGASTVKALAFTLFWGTEIQTNDNGPFDNDPRLAYISILPEDLPGGGGCTVALNARIVSTPTSHYMFLENLTIFNPSTTLTVTTANLIEFVRDEYHIPFAEGENGTQFSGEVRRLDANLAGGEKFDTLSRATRFAPRDVGASWNAGFGANQHTRRDAVAQNFKGGTNSGAAGDHIGFVGFKLGPREGFYMGLVEYRVRVVPEPASVAGLALGLLLFLRRSKG